MVPFLDLVMPRICREGQVETSREDGLGWSLSGDRFLRVASECSTVQEQLIQDEVFHHVKVQVSWRLLTELRCITGLLYT